jgi:hypothetical protein
MRGHTPEEHSSGLVATIVRYGAYLLLWVLLSAIGGLLAWYLRINLFDLGVWLRWSPWVVRGVDRWIIFVLGLLWLAYIFSVEGYLRNAVEQQRLWAKARPVLIIMLILLAIAYGLQLPAISFTF